MDIKELRNYINKLDEQLVHVLAKRMDIVNKIVHLKKEKDIQIHDSIREKEILAKMNNLAEELGLSKALIEDIFNRIFEETRG